MTDKADGLQHTALKCLAAVGRHHGLALDVAQLAQNYGVGAQVREVTTGMQIGRAHV